MKVNYVNVFCISRELLDSLSSNELILVFICLLQMGKHDSRAWNALLEVERYPKRLIIVLYDVLVLVNCREYEVNRLSRGATDFAQC